MESKKLKPAKQALADAIHQNGGWRELANYAVQSDCDLRILFTDEKNKPSRCVGGGWRCKDGFMFFGATSPLKSKLPNWHQCILSRDEYLTAYPEQVNVEINNETEHRVEVEMKSESEVTIKVSDWHKNGELPPVGEVCIFDPAGGECYFNDDELKAKGHNVCIIAHTNYKKASGSVAVFKWDLDDCCGVSSANACSFRPLRTERDKAIDEIISTAKKIGWNSEMASQIIGEVAAELYDAGYRKEVK